MRSDCLVEATSFFLGLPLPLFTSEKSAASSAFNSSVAKLTMAVLPDSKDQETPVPAPWSHEPDDRLPKIEDHPLAVRRHRNKSSMGLVLLQA